MPRTLTVLLIALAACHSDISGPEAQRLAQALQNPWSDTSRVHLQELWNRIGGQPFRPDSADPGAPVDLRLDGTRVAARGFVFQLILEGQGLVPEPCRGERFTLLAWTLEEHSRAVILSGGDFSQTFARPEPCWHRDGLSRRPVLSIRELTGAEGPALFAVSGHASIRSLAAQEGCPFVEPKVTAYLRTRGIRCTRGTFRASADGTLEGGGLSAVELPQSTLPGVRWVVDCARSGLYRMLCDSEDAAPAPGG